MLSRSQGLKAMCGRYGRDIPWSVLRDTLDLIGQESAPNLQPELDICPTTQQGVARPTKGGMELAKMRWGLIPYWHGGKDLRALRLTTFNAKAETAATAPTFKGAFACRRCLVPASCWYEWTGPKGSKEKRRFTSKHEPWMALAGIWDRCKTADAGEVESFTIVTQPAGSPLNGYHDRAPVVLPHNAWSTWLDLGADATPLLGPESVDGFNVALAA